MPPHEIIGLPALSPSVEESKIVAWKKQEGDFVEADEAIASIQTDKAELDWLVTDDVYLAKILLQPGDTVPVGTPTCIFVEEADMVAAFKDYQPSSAESAASSSAAPATPPPPSSTTSAPPPPPATPSPAQTNCMKIYIHYILAHYLFVCMLIDKYLIIELRECLLFHRLLLMVLLLNGW